MSANIDSSSPEGTHGADHGPVNTPPRRREATASGQTQSIRNQSYATPRSKPATPTNTNYRHHTPPVTQAMDQENVFSGTGDESQDSAQPQASAKHSKRRNKIATPRQRKDQAAAPISSLDGSASPVPQPATRTPSAQITHATPIKQAYAGPTFHASPAASALPMPKFLSKSMPSGAPPSGMQAQLDDDLDGTSSSTKNGDGSVESQSQRPTLKREESPLDFFFNAHRAEQARQNSSDGLASMGMRSPHSLTPASAERAGPAPGSRPGSRYHQNSRPSSGTHAEKAMFMMELDGAGESETSEDGRPSVPFKDRLGAARSASNLSHSQTSRDHEEEERQAKSQALKKLLLSHEGATTQYPQSGGGDWAGLYNRPADQRMPQEELQELSASPVPPREPSRHFQALAPQPTADVRAMENDLRRILKLDS